MNSPLAAFTALSLHIWTLELDLWSINQSSFYNILQQPKLTKLHSS